MSKFKTILTVCLIIFTSLLVTKTLQIQHSCNPMIHWSGEFPVKCQIANKDNFDSPNQEISPLPKQTNNKQKTDNSPQKEQPKIAQNFSKPSSSNITQDYQISISETSQNNTKLESKTELSSVVQIAQENAVKVGVAAGVITGAVVVIAGLPVYAAALAVAGVGAVVCLGIKTIL